MTARLRCGKHQERGPPLQRVVAVHHHFLLFHACRAVLHALAALHEDMEVYKGASVRADVQQKGAQECAFGDTC